MRHLGGGVPAKLALKVFPHGTLEIKKIVRWGLRESHLISSEAFANENNFENQQEENDEPYAVG